MLTLMRKIARHIAYLLLLALGHSSVAGAAGLIDQVLCIGADGHVAVELARTTKCNQFLGDESHATPPVGFELKSVSHCGSCFDLTLNVAQITKSDDFYDRTWLTTPPSPADLSIPSTTSVGDERALARIYPPGYLAPLHSVLRERRTVVIQV